MKFTNKVLVVALVAMVTFAVGATPTTNDLGTVLLRMQTAASPKNPFVDDLGDGTWSFKMTDGNLLPEDFTIATRPGFYGCGLSTYPMVMVNTTGASAGWGAESPYAANEVRAHPGESSDIRIEFKVSRSGVYRIEGSIRATDGEFVDGVLFREMNGLLSAAVVTTKDLATHDFGSGDILLLEGDCFAFEISRRKDYVSDSAGLMLRIIRVRDVENISKSINEAIAANPSGYGDTVETDWMNVTFGKTTSVGGEMTTLEHATDGTAFVGWRNVSGGKNVPDIFANVSGKYAVFASDILPMSPSELFVRPGHGVYDMIRFVSRVAGNYMMQLNIRDCDPGGEGTVAAVLVNGTLYKELNVDNNGNVFIPVYLEPLKVGDTVDFVYRSQKDGGQSTAGDSSALGIAMCEEEGLGDTKVLQALLDAGGAVVFPEGEYTIVKPLVIRSGTTLTCEEGVHIQMSDARALPLLVNEHFDAGADGDISVIGGLWDGRNIHRDGRQADPLILLAGVTNLTVRGLTVMNPVAGGIQLADVEDFLVEDVLFDCNGVTEGENGVVVNGFANRGMIRNLSGRTGKSFVVIDADGGSSRSAEKDISDITIDAIAGGETGVSAVDLVTRQASISNLTIRGVSGQFGKYGVAFSSGTGEGNVAGRIDNVAISNVTAVSSATSGRPADGIIWFREGVPDIGSIRIESLFRGEDVSYQNAVDTISVGAGVHIGRLELYDVLQTVAGSQELLAVDPTAVIDESIQGGSRHDTIPLKVAATRVVLPAQQGQAITNSLSSVFAQWIQTRQNPVETSLGVWTIRQSGVRQSGGDLLDAFYDNGNGIMGFRHEMVGGVASTVYPKAYLNTANVAAANDASENDLQPGECYGHPGATDKEGLQIIFQPFLTGDYGLQGGIRSVAKTPGDGVTFVGARFGSWEDEFFRVEHSATVRSASFATEAHVESGERVSFVLSRKSDYADDGTGLDLRISRGQGPSVKKLSADRIDVISNLNALASERGIYGYPDETVVNGLAVSFGRRDLPEGAFSSMGRFVLPGADFVGWRNGTDASAGATAETSTLPYALLNIAGTERCPPFADRFVRADEVALAPGCERAGVLRLVARRPFAGRQEFVFGFRDLQTDIAQGEGAKCRFLLRDVEVGRMWLPNGGERTYTLAVDGLETGDAIDVVVQPHNETVSAQTGNLTAVSLKWNRAVQGLALFLR